MSSESSDGGVRCAECSREVDEPTTIAERWLYYYDDRDLFPYCPTCARREFAPDAPASGRDDLSRRREAT